MNRKLDKRPDIQIGLDGKDFKEYYYLKEELIEFCRANNLRTTGAKSELTERIAAFLDNREAMYCCANRGKRSPRMQTITLSSIIEKDFVCSEKHRAFYTEQIGKSFSFNVDFQKWLKSNHGKTYKESISAYYSIIDNKKKNKTTIDRQFEYNTYVRDFFADNKGKNLAQAITCWKYKKQLKGHNRYERADLEALSSGEN